MGGSIDNNTNRIGIFSFVTDRFNAFKWILNRVFRQHIVSKPSFPAILHFQRGVYVETYRQVEF
jgi:hypothetical protein